MVQKLIYRLMSLAMLAGLICSCSRPQEKYSNAIPADANLVASLQLSTLAQKAGLNDEANRILIEQLAEAVKGEVKSTTFEHLEKLFRHPEKAGIDFESPVFLFSETKEKRGGAVAKVRDEEEVKTLIETILTESEGELTLQSGHGYRYVLMDDKGILAFTPNILLAYVNEKRDADVLKEAETLLQQGQENSLTAKPLFAQMQKIGGDVAMAATGDVLIQNNGASVIPADPANISVSISLSFEKGKINLQSTGYTEDEEWKKFIARQTKTCKPISNKFLKHFPHSTLAMASFGIDGMELYKYLEENGMFTMKEEEIDQALIREVCESLNGDITVGLTDFGMNSFSFLALTEELPSETLQRINRRLQEASEGMFRPEQEGDNYTVRIEQMNICYGIHEKKFYLTNDARIRNSLGESLTESVADAEYASTMKGESCAFIVNGQAIMEHPIVKLVLGLQGTQTMTQVLEKIDYLHMTGKEMEINVCLQLKDKDTNALKQIVDAAREMSGL